MNTQNLNKRKFENTKISSNKQQKLQNVINFSSLSNDVVAYGILPYLEFKDKYNAISALYVINNIINEKYKHNFYNQCSNHISNNPRRLHALSQFYNVDEKDISFNEYCQHLKFRHSAILNGEKIGQLDQIKTLTLDKTIISNYNNLFSALPKNLEKLSLHKVKSTDQKWNGKYTISNLKKFIIRECTNMDYSYFHAFKNVKFEQLTIEKSLKQSNYDNNKDIEAFIDNNDFTNLRSLNISCLAINEKHVNTIIGKALTSLKSLTVIMNHYNDTTVSDKVIENLEYLCIRGFKPAFKINYTTLTDYHYADTSNNKRPFSELFVGKGINKIKAITIHKEIENKYKDYFDLSNVQILHFDKLFNEGLQQSINVNNLKYLNHLTIANITDNKLDEKINNDNVKSLKVRSTINNKFIEHDLESLKSLDKLDIHKFYDFYLQLNEFPKLKKLVIQSLNLLGLYSDTLEDVEMGIKMQSFGDATLYMKCPSLKYIQINYIKRYKEVIFNNKIFTNIRINCLYSEYQKLNFDNVKGIVKFSICDNTHDDKNLVFDLPKNIYIKSLIINKKLKLNIHNNNKPFALHTNVYTINNITGNCDTLGIILINKAGKSETLSKNMPVFKGCKKLRFIGFKEEVVRKKSSLIAQKFPNLITEYKIK